MMSAKKYISDTLIALVVALHIVALVLVTFGALDPLAPMSDWLENRIGDQIPSSYWEAVLANMFRWLYSFWWAAAGVCVVLASFVSILHVLVVASKPLADRFAWCIAFLFLPVPMITVYAFAAIRERRNLRSRPVA